MHKVFIDGHNGSTGLRIHELLDGREDLELLTLDDSVRKDAAARRSALTRSDVAILCLPDDAAKEAVAWSQDHPVRVIDASSAHRVAKGWTYGLPELANRREQIRTAKLVANPGCYPTSFVLMLNPLIKAGHVSSSTPIAIHALSGYSGGGRSLIEKWQSIDNGLQGLPYEAPYGLDRIHKHIPEMTAYSGLELQPQFIPAVGPFHNGMRVQIPLHSHVLKADAKTVWQTIDDTYHDEPFVQVMPFDTLDPNGTQPIVRDEATFSPQRCNGTNRVELYVLPNSDGHVLLIGILDNLGKGASGAAVQNLNLMLGLAEGTGLAT